MKLSKYMSVLTAAVLLTGACNCAPVYAVNSEPTASADAGEPAATEAPAETAPAETTVTTAAAEAATTETTPAAEQPEVKTVAEGTIGDTAEWALYMGGKLVITARGSVGSNLANALGDMAVLVKTAEIVNADPDQSVTAIPKNYFQKFKNLTALTLPDTVTEIGNGAFSGTALTSVKLPVCTLGSGAFSDCTALTAVDIPEGVKVIPAECFRGCTALESITLPDSVEEVLCGYFDDQGAFTDCSRLNTVSFGTGIKKIDSRAFHTKSPHMEVIFRDGCTIVPEKAFQKRSEVEELTLPDSIREIGNFAFDGCEYLTTVSFPDELEAIGACAFRDCAIPNAMLPGCTLGTGAFQNCCFMKTLTVGNGTTEIPAECFRGCKALRQVTLSETVKTVRCGYYTDQGAFAECPELYIVAFHGHPESIDSRAFFTGSGKLQINLNHGMTEVPEKAFQNCTDLVKVWMPDTMETIGSFAFDGCVNLAECDLNYVDKPLTVGQCAFRSTALTEVKLGDCTLGTAAFMNCKAMKEAVIAGAAEEIPSECFRGCETLEKVWLADDIKQISCGYYNDQGAFSECPNLKSVSFGSGLEKADHRAFRTGGADMELTFRAPAVSVPENAFQGCTEITKVTLPKTMHDIGANAFAGCENLAEMNFPFNLQSVGNGAFSNTALTSVKINGCTFGTGAFRNCRNLLTVEIGEGTETIPPTCFAGCTSLKTVRLPDSVKAIRRGYYNDEGAFNGCTNLKQVSLGKQTEQIDSRTFLDAGTDVTVTFRRGTELLPTQGFLGSTSVSTVELPETVTAVYEKTFGGSSIGSLYFYNPECVIADSENTIPESTVIFGYADSTAQAYAEKYGRTFILIHEFSKFGSASCDLDGDGKTTSLDAKLLMQYVCEDPAVKGKLDEADVQEKGDIDGNGLITANDVYWLLNKI